MLFIPLILIFNLSCFFLSETKLNTSSISLVQDQRKQIDRLLEELGSELEANNYIESCIHASDAATLIKQNLKGLELIEPYYNWRSIREVLLDIPKVYCKVKTKSVN